jgi:hypothetical protein
VLRWIVTSSIVLGAAGAAAEPTDPVRAKTLFDEGRALASRGEHAAACGRFAESLALDHKIGTELNLADCNERLGHVAEAWRLFDVAAGEAKASGDEREAYARGRADTLVTRLMTIVVKIPQPMPPALKVTIGGRDVQPAAEIRERIDPGDVEVIATAPDRPRFARVAKGIAGATVIVEVRADEPPVETGTTRRRSRVYLAWGLGGVAAASAIVSAALIVKAKRDYDHAADGSDCMHTADGRISCNDAGNKAIHDSQRLGWISTGFAAGAGVLLAGAAVVYFTAPRDSIAVAPIAAESAVGVVVAGRF